ncbi:MAG TPA: hydroxymethylglutaryl-CoA synthase [Gammaproteobacteria bacterium]|nr:hydroxymethylglutaryl-CoA synthase [Gammaproteobacteria bacterium]
MHDRVGISGFGIYLPPYRVDLENWCEWTGAHWDKTSAVIGRSFRMRGPDQSVYTMAANAVLKLVDQYDIDPRRVGFLGLGTESSTDNSAGAIIVKGMLDEGLRSRGLPEISRHCEVPEIKHACLGGIYALKHGLRYLALESEPRCAIVVSADIAEYARGSTGEPTQGAGAIAMLLERDPQLLDVELRHIGSASAYRAVDFRKPVMRNVIRGKLNCHFQDLPVFNGKYSTTCYLDETLHALEDMLRRMGRAPADYYDSIAAAFMHRPYHRMPLTSFALSYLFGLANNGARGRQALAAHCITAALDPQAVLAEMRSRPDIMSLVRNGDIDADVYPLSIELVKAFRTSPTFESLVAAKMSLGAELMKDIGNVYCAALPGWIAAGLEEALERGVALDGRPVLAVGYGSGDAAEAMPMTVAAGWRNAAAKIGFRAALEPHQTLTRTQYESLHDRGQAAGLVAPTTGFVVDSVGSSATPGINDEGIEYYRFLN